MPQNGRAGVLLLAHGAPERLEDVESYLSYVRGGGRAPLRSWKKCAALPGHRRLLSTAPLDSRAGPALERALGIPVFFGMRNWRPFIRETMDRVRESGVERLAAIALAPQYSELSVGLYISRTEEAARAPA